MQNETIDVSGRSPDMGAADYRPWYRYEETVPVHDAVFSIINTLDKQQSYRQLANMRNMRLYNNQEGSGIFNTMLASPDKTKFDNRVTWNVVQSVIDTCTNKIAKSRPKATFLTIEGDWSLQRKAKLLDRFCQGLAHVTTLYEVMLAVFKDGCVFGTGAMYIYRDPSNPSRIKCERVFIDELTVDDKESFSGQPRQLHRRKFVDKEVLCDMYRDTENGEEKCAKIMACPPPPDYQKAGYDTRDQVLVVESWHLPSGPKAKDGKHSICISNCDLDVERYKRDYFPFVFWQWDTKLAGFWGAGLAERLNGVQKEINKILEDIRIAFKRVVRPRVFLEGESGNKVVTSHINSEIGTIVKVPSGVTVRFDTPTAFPAEVYQHLQNLYTKAFEIAGVSALSATGKKPDGLNAGKALREYSDIEAERFVTVGQRWEQAHMEAFRQMLDLAKEIKNFEVSAPSKRFIKKIKWDEIDLQNDQYIMQVFPTSMLSATPSGKLQDVTEMMQSGLLDKDWGLKLLDFPDLDGYMAYVNAAFDDLQAQIEECVFDEKYSDPEPYQKLDLGIQLFQSAYLRYKRDGAPEKGLENLRRWMDDASAMMQKAQAMQAAQAQAAQAAQPMPQTQAAAPQMAGVSSAA